MNLRIFSVNIINHFVKLRETCSFGIIGGKFDLNSISQNYNYDRNYLIKMKNDTDFLHNSNLRKFFNFSTDSDPFLVAVSDSKKDKTTIPLTDEMLLMIRNSQFILLQELIYYEVNRKKNETRNASSSYGRKNELKPLLKRSPDICNSTLSKIKPSSQSIRRDISNIRTTKELLTKELNEFSLDNAAGEHFEKARKYDINNINLRKELLPAHLITDTSMLCIKSKTIANDRLVIDESKTYLQTDYEVNHKSFRQDTIETRTSIKQNNIEIKTLDSGVKDFTQKVESLDVKQPTIKEDKQLPSGVLDKIKHRYNDFIKSREQNSPMPQDVISSTMKEANNKNITFSGDSPIPKELIVPKESLTAKDEKDNFDITRISFKFYTDKITKFDKIYKHFVSQLDNEQKTTFKMSNKLIDNLKGMTPKLIQINYNNILCGFASVNYEHADSTVKLVLSHFSTMHMKHYHSILSDLIEFLKQNFKYNELHLELHYSYKDEKFYMSQQISNAISKKLKFKWVTLENNGVERKVKYKLPHTKEAVDLSLNTFNIQFVVALSLVENLSAPESIRYIDKGNDINLFPFLYVLSEMSNQHSFKVATETFDKINTDSLRVRIFNLVHCLKLPKIYLRLRERACILRSAEP
jgi:hypothetical protein